MTKKYMTKKQAELSFKEMMGESLKTSDKIAIRTAWHMYTDSLCKDGQISQRQYDRWTSPRFCK